MQINRFAPCDWKTKAICYQLPREETLISALLINGERKIFLSVRILKNQQTLGIPKSDVLTGMNGS